MLTTQVITKLCESEGGRRPDSEMAHMAGTPAAVTLPEEDTARGHLKAGSGPKVWKCFTLKASTASNF